MDPPQPPQPPQSEQRPSRDRRASPQKRQRDLLATPHQTLTKYVPVDLASVPGPSGIKQCYRTVKSLRRVPVLSAEPSTSSPSYQSSNPAPRRRPNRVEPAQTPKRHPCRTCNKKFTSPGKLKQHHLLHTGELPFPCQHCDKRFNSKFKLVRHGLIHNELRPFACKNCEKTFHRKDHLANHERVHDPSKNVYICEKESCRKRYTSQLSYRKHVALHSAEEGNLECKICCKVFENQADIVYHLKVHAGSRTVKNETDKKFNCNLCERKFFTAKDVRRHLVVHTGRRDFVCQFCPQKFGRKDHLVRHVKKAHPDEPWQSVTPGTSALPDDIKPSSFTEDIPPSPGRLSIPSPSEIKPQLVEEQYYDIVLMDSADTSVKCEVEIEESDKGESSSMIGLASPVETHSSEPFSDMHYSQYSVLSSQYRIIPPDMNVILQGDEAGYSGRDASLVPTETPLHLLECSYEPLLTEETPLPEIMGMLDPNRPEPLNPPQNPLPAFKQVFQNAAQSPKPPRRPPK